MACYTKPYNLCPQGVINAKCVVYTGSNLTNISVSTNDRLDVILQNINEAVGDFDFNLFTEDTATLFLSGDGTSDSPLYGDVQVSSFPNNSLSVFTDGLYSPNTIQAGVVYGGIVTWLEDYTYHVSAAGYYINGFFYESPAIDITLSPPDLTDNRIDTFILNTSSVATVLEGTPSPTPSQAPLDPATQLEISLSLVEVGTTEPTLGIECLYKENTEWTSATSNLSEINPDSSTNPCFGVKTIEGTGVHSNVYFTLTRSSAFTPASIYTQLTFFIRNKGSWANSRYLSFQWQLGNTNVGATVKMFPGSFGFNASNTTTCQVISIPMSNFGLGPLTSVDRLKVLTFAGTGGLPGYYMDEICLQDVAIVPLPTSTDEKVKVSLNDAVAGYLNGKLVAGTGITLTENNNGANETLTISSSGITSITADQGLTANTATNVQLGGTITNNRTITATSNSVIIDGTTGFGTLYAKTTTGTAFVAESTGLGTPILGMVANDIPYAIGTFKNTASTNTVLGVINVQRTTTGTAGDGIGGSIDFFNEISNGSSNISNQIISKWTTVDALTRTSQFILTGVNNIVTSDLFTLSGNGSLQLNEYGVGSFTTGTPIYNLSVTSTGQVIETLPGAGGEIISADNGLTENVPGNVQLGGTLIQSTSINLDTFGLNIDDIAGNGYVQVLPSSFLGTGTFFNIVSDNVTSNSNVTVDGTQIILLGVTPASTQTYSVTVASGATTLSYTDTVDTYRVGVGQVIGGEGIELFGLPNASTQDRLVGVTSSTSLAGYITIGSGLSLASGVLSSSGISGITADNGLTANTSTNVQLGGTLIQFTDIDNNGNEFFLHGTADNTLRTVNGTFQSNVSSSGIGASLTASNSATNLFSEINSTESAARVTSGNNTTFYNTVQVGATSISLIMNENVSPISFIMNTLGELQATAYGTGTFTGTAASYAAFDVNGNIIEVSGIGSGPVITADNGLTKNSATNVQWGGALLQNTTITGSTFTTTFTGSVTGGSTYLLNVTNSGSGGSILGQSTSTGVAVTGSATSSGIGVSASSISGVPLFAVANPTSTNTVVRMLTLRRDSSGTPTTGIGGAIGFENDTTTGTSLSNELISKWTDTTFATRTSQFIVTGVNSGTTGDILTLNGNKSIQLNGYGINTFAGTPTFTLGVDASGNVVEFTSAGAGANTALSNLASVAINTSLISDTDNTDDLGSASIGWKDAYVRTVKFDGSTSGTVTVQATAVAGTPTLTLPTVTGTITQYVEGTTASSSTPTPTGDARENYYDVTALAANATFGAPTGTPANHNSLLIRIKDNGTARTLAFNAIYRAGSDIALPTTTVISETMYLQFIYNGADSTWDFVGLTQGF